MAVKLLILLFVSALLLTYVNANKSDKKEKNVNDKPRAIKKAHHAPVPCTCGIFLSGQFKKGSKSAPKGEAVLTQEMETHFTNNLIGQRQCANKCLEVIIMHLPKSGNLICATIDRDCYKEKAYLWTKNYEDVWHNSNMSAGRDFCCKDNAPYKCPMV